MTVKRFKRRVTFIRQMRSILDLENISKMADTYGRTYIKIEFPEYIDKIPKFGTKTEDFRAWG